MDVVPKIDTANRYRVIGLYRVHPINRLLFASDTYLSFVSNIPTCSCVHPLTAQRLQADYSTTPDVREPQATSARYDV